MKLTLSLVCVLLAVLSVHPILAAGKKKAAPENKTADDKKSAAPGYLIYANTVGEKGWSFFVLDKEDIRPSGIEPGYRSAWVSYPAGKRQLQFEHQPLGLVDLEADLQSGALHAFIAYSDLVPQSERGRPPRPVLAVKELRCDLIVPPEKRKSSHLVLVNLTPAAKLSVRVGEEAHDLPRLRETLVKPAKRSGMVDVNVMPSPGLPSTLPCGPLDPPEALVEPSDQAAPVHSQNLNFEDAGTRFVVFYTDTQNKVQSLLFDDIGMYPETAEP